MALPVVVGAIGSAISFLMGFAITKALVALGIGYFIFQGMDVLFESAESQILSTMSGLPADIFGILMMCGAGEALTILLSAFSTRLLLMGFQNGMKAVMGVKPTG